MENFLVHCNKHFLLSYNERTSDFDEEEEEEIEESYWTVQYLLRMYINGLNDDFRYDLKRLISVYFLMCI